MMQPPVKTSAVRASTYDPLRRPPALADAAANATIAEETMIRFHIRPRFGEPEGSHYTSRK
jgi:hypothetical protein